MIGTKFFLVVFIFLSPWVRGIVIEKLVKQSWTGISMYVIVNRETVQQILDEFFFTQTYPARVIVSIY